MDIRGIFGANVRKFRLDAGLSQEAVAERMGVDRAFVSGIERGQQNATLQTIWQTAQAQKVKPVDLLDDTQVSMPASRRQRRAPRKTRSG
jgi:transcriptional regulator with XRE-family HTH domain